jgi:hypothetical protein
VEYTATRSASKGMTVEIKAKCPNTSTGRNQSAANIAPNVRVICRTEDTARGTCKDVTNPVDYYRVYIEGCKTSILFRPVFAIISGSKHSPSLAHLRLSSGKDVTIAGIDRQRCNVG